MTVSNCGSCEHWRKLEDFLQEMCKDGAGGTATDPDWGYCDLAEGHNGAAVNKTRAFASDYESYAAGLRTRADFGCVQHKPKEATTQQG